MKKKDLKTTGRHISENKNIRGPLKLCLLAGGERSLREVWELYF